MSTGYCDGLGFFIFTLCLLLLFIGIPIGAVLAHYLW